MEINKRLELIKQVGEEIITEEELAKLLKEKTQPIAYDGFEPSGTNIHIAQGLLRAININKMTKAGCKFKILVADWHAWANNKLGGNLENIKTVGKYLIEVWKACDIDLDNVEFLWVSDFVKDDNYWKKVMQVARHSTVKRITRCSQIMGRSEKETLQASQILYPCMQCADIFHLNVDITQLGMDQRKCTVLAREIGPKLGYWKPVAVHHHMLMGLKGIDTLKTGDGFTKRDFSIHMKMSKSDPNSAIFMNDSEDMIKGKINKAYCPEKTIEFNPILEYCKYIIFERFDSFKVERPEKWGGNLEFKSYEELEKEFSEGKLHPMDLKQSVAKYLNQLLGPVRKRLEKNKTAQKLIKEIVTFKVTR